MAADRYAPGGKVWLCMMCGKTAKDMFGEERGWDESCAINCIAVEEGTPQPTEEQARQFADERERRLADHMRRSAEFLQQLRDGTWKTDPELLALADKALARRNAGVSLLGLGQRDRIVSRESDVDQRVAVPAAGAGEEAAHLIDLRLNRQEHDEEVAAPAGPHAANPTLGVPAAAAPGAFIDPALLAKAVMAPEEENTVRRGCCPKCMERTLGEPVEGGGIRYRQCTRCASIYAVGVPAVQQTVTIETLRQHWLHAMECDHATGRDKPHCACSRVDLGWHPSVGAAVEAWLAHVAGVNASSDAQPEGGA